MGAYRNYKDESRSNWGTSSGDTLSIEQINCGAILRIADATEAMAKNHTALIEEKERYRRWYSEEVKKRYRLERSNAALRGVITKLKTR